MRNWPALFLVVVLTSISCAPRPQQSSARFRARHLQEYFPGNPDLDWQVVGRSVQDRRVYAIEFGKGPETTLIIGGFHGNEKTSMRVALRLCEELATLEGLLRGRRVVVLPILNPDGYVSNRRQNSRGVDLNRNLPTENWGDATLRKKDRPGAFPASEPETFIAMRMVERYRPDKILSLHSPFRVNNYDGEHSRGLASAMAVHNRYPVKGFIGYPTPGSFGTWAGIERGIPTVTLEIPTGDPALRWRENKWALMAALRFDSGRRAK